MEPGRERFFRSVKVPGQIVYNFVLNYASTVIYAA
jgi:hypothetical protein